MLGSSVKDEENIDRSSLHTDVLLKFFESQNLEEKNEQCHFIFNQIQNPHVKLVIFKFILPIFNEFNAFFQSEKSLIYPLYTESVCFNKLLASNFIETKVLSAYDDNIATFNVYNPHNLLLSKKLMLGFLKYLKFYQKAMSEVFKRLPIAHKSYILVSN
ncbi:uncharacterized protein LOC111614836 [Centruroides sculpturatus]|uniref:uncharacterized protein LOC111614836 n=1 Tax=Centruroides sculpturatus TaxID=218467 RepID=UPI000C6C9C1A|nr:uncharacterized protein LOC111614836 [Centruroides sculpturatus]